VSNTQVEMMMENALRFARRLNQAQEPQTLLLAVIKKLQDRGDTPDSIADTLAFLATKMRENDDKWQTMINSEIVTLVRVAMFPSMRVWLRLDFFGRANRSPYPLSLASSPIA
jgi:hypothetical protein